jgi:hypothetical protein
MAWETLGFSEATCTCSCQNPHPHTRVWVWQERVMGHMSEFEITHHPDVTVLAYIDYRLHWLSSVLLKNTRCSVSLCMYHILIIWPISYLVFLTCFCCCIQYRQNDCPVPLPPHSDKGQSWLSDLRQFQASDSAHPPTLRQFQANNSAHLSSLPPIGCHVTTLTIIGHNTVTLSIGSWRCGE